MRCTEFLERHSEYVDGQLPPTLAQRWRAHARVCRACGRYDSVVRRGSELVREVLPRLAPSPDFEPRLQHRLFHVRDDRARRTGRSTLLTVTLLLVTGGAAVGMALRPAPQPVLEAATVVAAPPELVGPATPVRVPIGLARATPAREAARPVHWPVYSRASYVAEFEAVRTSADVGPVRATLLLNE